MRDEEIIMTNKPLKFDKKTPIDEIKNVIKTAEQANEIIAFQAKDIWGQISWQHTALTYALSLNRCDIASYLLYIGADPNICAFSQKIFEGFHHTYYAALYYAVNYNNHEMVKLLLQHGAAPMIFGRIEYQVLGALDQVIASGNYIIDFDSIETSPEIRQTI